MSNNDTEDETEETAGTVSSAALEDKLSELEIMKQSIDEKKKLAEEYYDQLLRLRADFENYRRRSEKEKQTHLEWGKEEILLKQVGLLDILEQASNSINSNANIESIQKGLELIKQEFEKMLASEGIVEIESKDKRFDPNFHEAIDFIESEDSEGIIVDVLQKGYSFNGRVVRPSKVKVTKKTVDSENNIKL